MRRRTDDGGLPFAYEKQPSVAGGPRSCWALVTNISVHSRL
jgi:hypothetical protein